MTIFDSEFLVCSYRLFKTENRVTAIFKKAQFILCKCVLATSRKNIEKQENFRGGGGSSDVG